MVRVQSEHAGFAPHFLRQSLASSAKMGPSSLLHAVSNFRFRLACFLGIVMHWRQSGVGDMIKQALSEGKFDHRTGKRYPDGE